MNIDDYDFDSDDQNILNLFGVGSANDTSSQDSNYEEHSNISGEGLSSERSDNGQLDFGDSDMEDSDAQEGPRTLRLSASDIILASCALAPETAASKVMRLRNHSLQRDYNSGKRIVRDISDSLERKIEYLCRVCLKSLPNSTATCCEDRESWRSKRSRMITIVSFSVVQQIRHIFERNLEVIVESHREGHCVRAGSVERERRDLHSTDSYIDGLETYLEFERKEIVVSLTLSMDSYPFYRAGRGSATPVLVSIQDLPARLRNKPENVPMMCIVGSRGGKLPPALWKKLLDSLVKSLEGEITVNNWKISFRMRTCVLDADAIREHYNHVGWAGYHGCFFCLHPGKNVNGTVKYPPWNSLGMNKPPDRNIFNVLSHSRLRTHGFKGGSYMHQIVPLPYVQLDALHLLDLGFSKDFLKACQSSESPLYVGPNHAEILSEVKVNVPHDWAQVRTLNEQKLTGTELAVHSISTLMLLAVNDTMGDSTRVAFLGFCVSTYIRRLRARSISNTALSEIFKIARFVEGLLMAICGEKSYTYKFHCALSHVPDRIDSYGLPDDYTMHPFESINRLLSTGRTNSMSRGYEAYAGTRFIVSSYLTRETADIATTRVERKQLDQLFGKTPEFRCVSATTKLAQPQKSNRYSSLVPGNFYRTLSIDSYSYKIRDYVQLVTGEFGRIEAISVSYGSVRVVLSSYPTTPAIDEIYNIHRDQEVASFRAECLSSNVPEFAVYQKNSPISKTVVMSDQIRCKALFCYSDSYSFPKHIFTSLYIRTRYE